MPDKLPFPCAGRNPDAPTAVAVLPPPHFAARQRCFLRPGNESSHMRSANFANFRRCSGQAFRYLSSAESNEGNNPPFRPLFGAEPSDFRGFGDFRGFSARTPRPAVAVAPPPVAPQHEPRRIRAGRSSSEAAAAAKQQQQQQQRSSNAILPVALAARLARLLTRPPVSAMLTLSRMEHGRSYMLMCRPG